MIDDLQAWRDELLSSGAVVQDGDDSVDPDEAERRCLRYVALVDMVDGSEDAAVFRALIDSMTAVDDYGVYQSTLGAAFRFPPRQLGRWLFEALASGFLARDPERAGDWLGQLAFLAPDSEAIEEFNAVWASSDGPFAEELLRFVEANESDGWLGSSSQVGRLRPTER